MLEAERERELLARLKKAVVEYNEGDLLAAIEDAFREGLDARRAIFEGLVPGMEEVSRLYEEEVYYIPELLLCAEVLYRGLSVLKEHVEKKDLGIKGTVIIGVVEGDIHDIGKNLVKMMLEGAGFEVIDLGRDVPLHSFLAEHRKVRPDIVCLSTMMTTTLAEMKKVVKELRKRNPRVKIMVGGAPLSDCIARRWGVSGYAPDAHLALKKAVEIMQSVKENCENCDE
ncbi:Methanogenic corrinoid protein MtbC1 [Desulfofundulus australicus DSM 11792]|uniref:Methanogenic corrinoid protein MtbC1 n=1 Tax=Desulfofundulus australicus DSM 11792 TaxID=1121425 RepID=A0A1M4Z9S8_9FIRM|nr:corrinoid protein [Desulfofundulus australicus]SHF14823.1 Methanogenic corrinoid protein MtbC1 [Desulfofundulus australicus DSM 11792]